MFRADSIVLNNQVMFAGGEDSFSLSQQPIEEPVVLHLRMGPCEISFIRVGVSSGVVIKHVLFRQPHC